MVTSWIPSTTRNGLWALTIGALLLINAVVATFAALMVLVSAMPMDVGAHEQLVIRVLGLINVMGAAGAFIVLIMHIRYRAPRMLLRWLAWLNAAAAISVAWLAWREDLSLVFDDSTWLAWAFVLVLLINAAVFGMLQPRRRPDRFICVACGYDLRASPGRCPECGTPVPSDHSTSAPGG